MTAREWFDLATRGDADGPRFTRAGVVEYVVAVLGMVAEEGEAAAMAVGKVCDDLTPDGRLGRLVRAWLESPEGADGR